MALPIAITPGDPGHVDDHEEIHELLSRLDGQSAFLVTGLQQGVLGDRPAAGAGNQGLFYWATDVPSLFYSDGSTWRGPEAFLNSTNQFTAINEFADDVRFASGRPWFDVTHSDFGASADGVTDDTAAIQAAADAAVALGGGIVFFPVGDYLFEGVSVASAAVTFQGCGSPGQDASVGDGATVLRVTGAGNVGISWAVGEASARFNGVTIRDLHVRAEASAVDGTGIHLGDASNCVLERASVSGFTNGIGVIVGESGSTGSQYNVLSGVIVSNCEIGIDLVDTNGCRISNCFLEHNVVTPPAGTIGVRIQSGSDTATLVGTVMQGFETLVDLDGSNASLIGCRYEGFTTALDVSGDSNNVLGGSINNSLAGGGGTGLNLSASSSLNLVFLADTQAVATIYADAGTANTIMMRPSETIAGRETKWPAIFLALAARTLTVNKAGGGAQNPEFLMQSNGSTGPTLKTEDSFLSLILDHAFATATAMKFRIRGTDVLRLSNTGAALGIGFYGTAPQIKPSVGGSVGGNAALTNLLAALDSLGLIEDVSSP